MSRIISVDGTGTERTRLTKSIVVALRELMKQKQVDAYSYDLSAYVVLALRMINLNVEKTVVAWEKRDYWLKADKFRMQWGWVSISSEKIHKALLSGDWAALAIQAAQVGQKLAAVKVSEKHRLGTPWIGAWKRLQEMN